MGWITPFNSSLILILPKPEEEAVSDALTQLFRIGYERIEGYLSGGIESWLSSGRKTRTYSTAGVEDLLSATASEEPVQILDVRQQGEWNKGHIAGSTHIFVSDLLARLEQVPKNAEQWTICATGHRASIAASLLDRARIPVRLVARQGVPDYLAKLARS